MAKVPREKNGEQEKSPRQKSKLSCYFWTRDQFLPATACTSAQANVLLALAGYANPDGTSIRPGKLNLNRATKYDRDTIREAIKFWVNHPSGVLDEVSKGSGRNNASVFQILLSDITVKGADSPHLSQDKGADSPPVSTDKGADSTAERGGKGADSPPIPSLPKKNNTYTEEKERAAQTAAPPSIVLPEWLLPFEKQWNDFRQHRMQIKKPLHSNAQQIIVNALLEMSEAGDDPGKVLEQSIAAGWSRVFPLPNAERIRPGGKSTAQYIERFKRNARIFGFPAARTSEEHIERLEKNAKLAGLLPKPKEQK